MREIHPEIILIGPQRAGKSTIGRLLAEKLVVPQVSMDALCRGYYREKESRPGAPPLNGPDGMMASEYKIYALQRLLADHSDCVIDLGAGHSVYRDEASLARVQEILTPYPNVVLLLPCADLDAAERVLQERNRDNEWLNEFRAQSGYDPNEHFLRHRSNFDLARIIVYTEGKSPEETRDEILSRIEHRPQRSTRPGLTWQQDEMANTLAEALEAAANGRMRSLILITMTADGDSGCWARIHADEDRLAARDYLDRLKKDFGTKES
jgi:shikimate kinase